MGAQRTWLLIALVATISMSLSACGVSRTNEVNYMPHSSSKSGEYYECLRDAQQYRSGAVFSANAHSAAGAARGGTEANGQMLESCMRSKGYQLRSLTDGETVWSILTFPFALVFTLFGAYPGDFY